MNEKDIIKDLVATLRAAEQGDLRVRPPTCEGPLGELAQAMGALLGSLEARTARISYAATAVIVAAEAASGALPGIAEGMAKQQAAVAEIARKLKALEARSEEIGQIVEMLDDVTSETNILSLNAAIEASRAGAQGKGFGLVAEEVRKMAERAASATKDIGAYIETIANATGEATGAIETVRTIADQLAGLTGRASGEAKVLAELRDNLTSAIGELQFTGQGEVAITRILHDRREDLSRLLTPLAPMVGGSHTPLGEALRNLLAALGEGPKDRNA
jgi:methyl-accepting chemotaxis protein